MRDREFIMETKYMHIKHPFEAVYDEQSEILILGTLPSVKSREENFYYGHKQNRFWKVLAAVYEEKIPDNVEEKKDFLLRHHIAIWDVIDSCDIVGSSDSSIKNVNPTNLVEIIQKSKIKRIYVNGKKAEELYQKYQYESTQIKSILLPSTSPANATWNMEKLMDRWKVIRD